MASFVAAVGNVPFGKISLHDPTHNRRGHSIHNHFIVKSLRLCAPGGIVAVVTSSYTLDAQNPAARREMAELADLVGAVRLPSGAMRRMAGTEVVCDLVVLRRREAGRAPDETGWERSVDVDTAGGPVRMNEYFAPHPEMILGEPTRGAGHVPRRRPGGRRPTWTTPGAACGYAVDHLVCPAMSEALRFGPTR